jgi:hypothetical protein
MADLAIGMTVAFWRDLRLKAAAVVAASIFPTQARVSRPAVGETAQRWGRPPSAGE